MERVVEVTVTVLSCNAGMNAKAEAEDKLRMMEHWQDGWYDVGMHRHQGTELNCTLHISQAAGCGPCGAIGVTVFGHRRPTVPDERAGGPTQRSNRATVLAACREWRKGPAE